VLHLVSAFEDLPRFRLFAAEDGDDFGGILEASRDRRQFRFPVAFKLKFVLHNGHLFFDDPSDIDNLSF
jgi:hypothetical protein